MRLGRGAKHFPRYRCLLVLRACERRAEYTVGKPASPGRRFHPANASDAAVECRPPAQRFAYLMSSVGERWRALEGSPRRWRSVAGVNEVC